MVLGNKKYEMDTCRIDLSQEDILAAMADIDGYLDITTDDFKMIYSSAYAHALKRLTQSVSAQNMMTRDVIRAHRDDPLKEVALLLARHVVTGVPVVDDKDRVVGVISEKDFLRHLGTTNTKSFMGLLVHCLEGKKCMAMPARKQTAADIMSSPPVTVTSETSSEEIARIMSRENINRLPVVDKENRLLGLVSRTDLVQSFCLV